jgi:hypothetical protein
VAELKALTSLDLQTCSLSDEGLQHLRGLKQLTSLCLHGCCTSEPAELDLERQCPGLGILHLHDDDFMM